MPKKTTSKTAETEQVAPVVVAPVVESAAPAVEKKARKPKAAKADAPVAETPAPVVETAEAAASFGFTADDIGDYLFDVLASYDHDFSSLEFLTGDNSYVTAL